MVPALKTDGYFEKLVDASEYMSEFRLRQMIADARVVIGNVTDWDLAAHQWGIIGLANGRLGKLGDALACLANACKLAPNNIAHKVNASAMLIELGRPEDALDYLNEAHEATAGKELAVLLNLAESFHLLGQQQDALAYFEEATRLDSTPSLNSLYSIAATAALIDLYWEAAEYLARFLAKRNKLQLGDQVATKFIAGLPDELEAISNLRGGERLISCVSKAQMTAHAVALTAQARPVCGEAGDLSDADAVAVFESTKDWRIRANEAVLGES